MIEPNTWDCEVCETENPRDALFCLGCGSMPPLNPDYVRAGIAVRELQTALVDAFAAAFAHIQTVWLEEIAPALDEIAKLLRLTTARRKAIPRPSRREDRRELRRLRRQAQTRSLRIEQRNLRRTTRK